MAAHTNRSPSPLSSRPTTNPNPRNSEIHSSTRRSFNGNSSLKPSSLTNPRRFDPITPANSPSVVSGRSSVGKDCTGSYLKDCEGKENSERDQIKSPAKGSKNFMTPTISAASKITPSPKKRPFVERNDLVRTSISLSDGKAMFFSNASEDLDSKSDMNKKVPTSYLNSADSPVPKSSKKVTFLDVPQEALSDSVVTDSDCPKMESFSKNESAFCSPLLTRIAPLDADPSMPPYDPKTNFLSPRPQFLYYKPNPRIEILLNKENLFENSSSDSEGTEVSMDSEEILETIASSELVDLDFSEFVGGDNRDAEEDPEKEKLEAIASADMYEGLELEFSEFVSGDNRAAEEDPEKEKLEAIASADMYEGLELEDGHFFLNEESSSVEKDKKKTRGSSRFVCFSVLTMMLLTFACVLLFIMRSPLFEEFGVIKESTFSDLEHLYHQSRAEEATADAKVMFDRVIRRVDRLFVYSTAVILKMVDEFGKGEITHLGPVKYVNLSSGLEMDFWNDGRFLNRNDEVGKNSVENAEDDDDALYEELDAEIADFEEELEAYEEVNDSIENIEEEHETQEDDVLETKEKIHCDSSNSASEYSEDTQSQEEIIIVPNVTPADQLASIISQVKTEPVPPEIMEIEKSSGDIINHSPDTDQESLPDVNSLTESVQSSLTPERELIIAHNYHTIGIISSSLFVGLFAFAAYFYGYRGNPSLSSDNVVQANISSTKPEKKAFTSDDDVMDVSPCPSEMSSFQKNVSSYNNRKKEIRGLLSEVQSVDRNTRKQQPSKRESLASSSSEFTTGSPSYGSFTTFEKIPLKNATGEEEIITPVRRSSRIRNHNQFTSP
ncbi:hypothetical protein STAS_26356 [Striga asiatica]|uniref:Uncharacterized protein n=1 Tax=Striga asiatica TaxID=4170 RepID=A0A5A7QUW5_STRAF|nr:hypothetical protein STAS_26356 [Striga asiatica]